MKSPFIAKALNNSGFLKSILSRVSFAILMKARVLKSAKKTKAKVLARERGGAVGEGARTQLAGRVDNFPRRDSAAPNRDREALPKRHLQQANQSLQLGSRRVAGVAASRGPDT